MKLIFLILKFSFEKLQKKLSDSEQKELEEDLKRLLLERQKLIDEKLKEKNQ